MRATNSSVHACGREITLQWTGSPGFEFPINVFAQLAPDTRIQCLPVCMWNWLKPSLTALFNSIQTTRSILGCNSIAVRIEKQFIVKYSIALTVKCFYYFYNRITNVYYYLISFELGCHLLGRKSILIMCKLDIRRILLNNLSPQ